MKLKLELMSAAWLAVCGCVSGPSPKEQRQAEIQYDLGVDHLRSGRPREALREFLASEKINPEFAELQNALGLTYYLLGNSTAALQHFEKALQLKPDYSEVLNNMARVYIAQGRFRPAIELLEKALQDVFLRERYLAESNLGWALFQVGEKERAYQLVKNALAQNQRYCVGYQYLGLMQQSDKDLEMAAQSLGKALEYCPEFTEAKRDLGKVLLMQGEVNSGCRLLKECQEAGPMTQLGQECERLWRASCQASP
jgi:type IV pilus assembly protein PilF